jgi:hypothetical protein
MHATVVDSGLAQSLVLPGRALNWIDGKWIDAKLRTKSFDPATGEEIGTYADANREDAAAARWFDETQFGSALKLKVGRDNANRLLRLGLETLSRTAAASFGA